MNLAIKDQEQRRDNEFIAEDISHLEDVRQPIDNKVGAEFRLAKKAAN
ncbi:hypothetical protein [Lederbergia ruris]|nr:hypothetical protein [Lederbergia ruris]